jgi:hypothetical protein
MLFVYIFVSLKEFNTNLNDDVIEVSFKKYDKIMTF